MTTFSRRRFTLSLAGAAWVATPAASAVPATAGTAQRPLPEALAALESTSGGRLGLAVSDGTRLVGHRVDERFALCSTFKLPLAAAVLQRCARGDWSPDQWVPFSTADRVPHAPITGPQMAAGGMRLLALAEAAQRTSDNVAANLLLRLMDGPAGFTAWLRAQGDPVTRVDRYEPAMNEVPAGSTQDTTSPAAMAALVGRFFSDGGLDAASQATLRRWMQATRTGQRRLRAGLPPAWASGDKTGTGLGPGRPDRIHDVAVVWPGAGRPVWTIAAYYDGPRQDSPGVRAADEAVLARAARLAAGWLRTRQP